MPGSRKPNATVADILEPFPARVRRISEQLRKLVTRTIPTATEHAYPGWKAIGYRDPHAGYFAGIFPQLDHVRLLFEHGAALEDPDGLLEGENVRQVRWIVLRYGAPLPRAAIASLLRRAVLYGSTRR
ncbi:MAG TPA: DUF1801 domain-containing protein [Gemmatimonadaceae bacterium]|jgi:hypothetical protein|nr:DUF1801 domain-containing protein [Gemmatimonadaceae bacterium]